MLNEETLFGPVNKVSIAIERIKTFEPMALNIDPAGYYVCISGGKDSSVIQELCIMAAVKCEFVHNHTSVDNPETVYFIRREKERIKALGHIFRVEFPRYKNGKQKTMWNLIPKNGLPTMVFRWCCKELKEYGGLGRYCITGVRWEESARRSNNRALHEISGKTKDEKIILNNDNDMKRRLTEICIPKRKFVLNPIVDWTEADVWEFIKARNLPYNPLYDSGYKRVGCIGCPLSHNHTKELNDYPKYKAAYFRAGKKWIEHRINKGLDHDGIMGDPEKYFDWWLNGLGGLYADKKTGN
jgi:phosphoadenosine phosphosulfate reductase